MRSPQKNNHIYQKMAEKLVEAGLGEVEWKDVRTKIDNLTRKYKNEVKDQGTTGGAPSKWIYFQQVHRILGNFKSMNITKFINESTDVNPFEDSYNATTSFDAFIESPASESTGNTLCTESNESWDTSFHSDEATTSTGSTGSQRRQRRKVELTPFEAAMVEATNRRTDELVNLGRNLNDAVERRAKTLERIEKILDRMEKKYEE